MNYIKTHIVALLFVGIIVFSIIRIAAAFYSGISTAAFDVFTLLFTEPIRYILIVVCLITAVIKEVSRKRKVSTIIALTLLIIIGLIPTGHFVTLGALQSIHRADPEQFRNAARELLNEYEPNTLFSDSPQRNLDQIQIPRSQIPYSILRANIRDIYVLEKYILIEKRGLGGSFRGFIVFREDTDIWNNDKSVMLLEGCSYCWKIRIIDGLYWYHAAPVEEGNARLDFLSE